jgi:hypothetical protein
MQNSCDKLEQDTDDNLAVAQESFIPALIKHLHYRQMYINRISCDKTNMMLRLRDDQTIEFLRNL